MDLAENRFGKTWKHFLEAIFKSDAKPFFSSLIFY